MNYIGLFILFFNISLFLFGEKKSGNAHANEVFKRIFWVTVSIAFIIGGQK